MWHVKVYDLEMVNPDLKTKFPYDAKGRLVRGWYAWKPVVLKQALRMFPYVLYMDAGMRVAGKMDLIFYLIKKRGYFFITNSHTNRIQTTQFIVNKFGLNTPTREWILDATGVSAGFQGVSRTVYSAYILPMYELASDLRNFADDGTSPRGYGGARHDQAIASIFVRTLGYAIVDLIDIITVERKKIRFNYQDFFRFKNA